MQTNGLSNVHLETCELMSFDIIFRYLLHLGYKVTLCTNITDVGHIVDDAEDGEIKLQKSTFRAIRADGNLYC
jgi:cysteinyl-tRNA synthetase